MKSTASCAISDIEGFLFGGLNARFWILRKHFNSMSRQELDHAPFYSWQCISLQLPNRDIDLVIPNECDMRCFLKLLMYRLKTVDGRRGSATKLLEEM